MTKPTKTGPKSKGYKKPQREVIMTKRAGMSKNHFEDSRGVIWATEKERDYADAKIYFEDFLRDHVNDPYHLMSLLTDSSPQGYRIRQTFKSFILLTDLQHLRGTQIENPLIR